MDSISLVQVEVTNTLLVWLEVTLSFAAGLNQRNLLKFSENFTFLKLHTDYSTIQTGPPMIT